MPIMSSVFFPPTTATVACFALAAFCAAISSCFAAFLRALLEVSPALSAMFAFEVSMFAGACFIEEERDLRLSQRGGDSKLISPAMHGSCAPPKRDFSLAYSSSISQPRRCAKLSQSECKNVSEN
jgi:hypothetical protein